MAANEVLKSVRQSAHSITMDARAHLIVTGVSDVIRFDEQEVILASEEGIMHISGENLHITRLNLAEAQVIIEGLVDGIEYENVAQKGGLFSRMFG